MTDNRKFKATVEFECTYDPKRKEGNSLTAFSTFQSIVSDPKTKKQLLDLLSTIGGGIEIKDHETNETWILSPQSIASAFLEQKKRMLSKSDFIWLEWSRTDIVLKNKEGKGISAYYFLENDGVINLEYRNNQLSNVYLMSRSSAIGWIEEEIVERDFEVTKLTKAGSAFFEEAGLNELKEPSGENPDGTTDTGLPPGQE